MLAVLDASAVRRWCHAAAETLAAHRAEIDDLNVFPIPDGDTGTNLELTLRSAREAVAGDESAGAGQVLRAMARGAVLGARGNSGVIVSQVLCGLADGLADRDEADGPSLVAGLRLAADAAYAAVAEPVEGTVLSVIRSCAEAAEALAGADLAAVLAETVRAADEALRRTPEQLDVLAQAGVVDAGGRGLVLLLAELAAVVTGEAAGLDAAGGERPAAPRQRDRSALRAVRESGSAEYGYEVQYLLHAEEPAVVGLSRALAALGDSLAVVGTGDGLFNVHVHVNDVGAAIEAGIEAGRPHRISVVRFEDQVAAEPAATRAGVALVAVAPGEGLADLFASEGVLVVDGGPTDNPSTAEVLAGVLATGAAQVVVLPNSTAATGVAELAAEQAREQGVRVAVVPTKSPVQGLAAVAVHDGERRFGDNVIAIAEAAAATRFAEVTVAVRDAITYAGRCAAGDVLGLIDGEVVEIGSDVTAMGISLVNRLVAAGGELVTVLAGSDEGAAEATAALVAHVRASLPFVEVTGYPGGQPHYPLLIGVE
ncbi:MAG TPA: DAK2 domain-containing protein [Jatrophihabitans sp.]|nr:DAK2 domain-containing protein [Jatrophihabitans sp.]